MKQLALIALLLFSGCFGFQTSDDLEAVTGETGDHKVPSPDPGSSGGRNHEGNPGCITATWVDADLFFRVLMRDSGNTSLDHVVEPGVEYVAPHAGIIVPGGTGISWPHTVRTLSFGFGGQNVALFSFFATLQIHITALDEQHAQKRGQSFLENVSVEDPERFSSWLESLEAIGTMNDHIIYSAKVDGEFRVPEALIRSTPTQDSLRSADIKAGEWRASLSLPIYRISPDHGFIEVSPLGEVQASLPPDPNFRAMANATLSNHGLGDSSFQDLHEFDAFGRGNCGTMTLS